MKKILITAFIGSENLGDEAIFVSICQGISSWGKVEISAFTLEDKKQYPIPNLRLIKTRTPLKIVRKISDCDLLLCGGGGIIQDETSFFNLIRHTYKVFIAYLLRKKFVFYAVGVGPLISPFNKKLTRYLFDRAAAITVRDKKSKEILENLGVRNRVVVTAEPTVSLRFNQEGVGLDFPLLRPYIVVSLRPWFEVRRFLPVAVVKALNLRSRENQEKYNNFVKTLADFLDFVVESRNLDIVFLPLWPKRDGQVHAEVKRLMKSGERCLSLEKNLNISQTMAIIKEAEMLVGMRLHSLIFSAINFVPFVALSYSPKVENFLEEISFSEPVIKVDKISLGKLKFLFDKIISNRGKIKKHLARKIYELQKREEKNMEILKAQF